jgi:TadE-like protein
MKPVLPRMLRTRPGRLPALNTRGLAVIEFAFVGPMLILVIFMILQIGMLGWAKSSLETAVRDAARFGITGDPGTGATRDASIVAAIETRMSSFRRVAGQQIIVTSKVYPTFEDITQPEKIKPDVNNNGVCNPGDSFEDYNGNGVYDADMKKSGYGGPNDVVIYDVTYPLEPIVPATSSFFGFGSIFNLKATVAMQNEPFAPAAAIPVLPCV